MNELTFEGHGERFACRAVVKRLAPNAEEFAQREWRVEFNGVDYPLSFVGTLEDGDTTAVDAFKREAAECARENARLLELVRQPKTEAAFSSSDASLEHARVRLGQLSESLQSYIASVPYMMVAEDKTSVGVREYNLVISRPIPASVAGFVHDIANAIRAALDQAGFECARANGKAGYFANFPFGYTRESASKCIDERSKDIPQEIFEAMMRSKPYKDGNVALWSLNQLCNTIKHRTLVPTWMVQEWGVTAGTSYAGIEPATPSKTFTNGEILIARAPLGARDRVSFAGGFGFTLGQVPTLRDVAMETALFVMIAEATSALERIKEAATRMDLFKGSH